MPSEADDRPLRFDGFQIDPAAREVLVEGRPIALGARAFDVLLALARCRERVVGRQELLDRVWPDLVVEDHNITVHISTLRKWLGPHTIATVPGRGYRLTARVAQGIDDGPAPAPAPPPTSPAGAPTHLPRELTPLIGREDALAKVTDLMARNRLVTLVGAGGMGKSLLAQHALSQLRSHADPAVCWVELASIDDPAALPGRIAEALDVRPGRGDPLDGLCVAAASLTLTIALDNAEHLAPDVARIAAALLEAAPGVRLLVTSQSPLRLASERIFRLGPLAVPEGPLPATLATAFGAVALFAERARGADAHFVLTDASAPAAIDLCRALDGLPLAIELAAARAPLLGVQGLAASMQDRLQLLTRNRDEAAPARQQTLRAALEWSHGVLDERERCVFRRMGVMADSASMSFIQQVVADEQGPLDAWSVLDALGEIVDRSLVTVLAHDPGAPQPRYRLLESPRFFAMEQLEASGEAPVLRRRHATALAAAFDAAWTHRWSGSIGALDWSRRLLQDGSNARDAMAWAQAAGEPDLTVALAAALFHALPRTLHLRRVALADLCESLADRVTSPRLRLRALEVAVRPMFHSSQVRSLALATQAVTLARDLDADEPDRWRLYQALCLWIMAAAVISEPSDEDLQPALAELEDLEDPAWPAQRRARGADARRLAYVPLGCGAIEQRQLTQRWIATLEAEGDETAFCMGALLDAEISCGDLDTAISFGEQVLVQLAGTRDEYSFSMVQSNLVHAYAMSGDAASARRHLHEVWPLVERWSMYALASDLPSLLAITEGRPRTAARLAGYSDAAYAACGLLRHPLEVAARERVHAHARGALGDETFVQLFAEGQRLRNDEIAALAFQVEDAT